MRFFSVFTYESTDPLPTEAQMTGMGSLIAEGMKAGWLIECEGVHFGTTAVRLRKNPGGKVIVTDGPFAETKEVVGGYALLNVADMAEAVDRTCGFLEHVHQGTWEIYRLFEMPAGDETLQAETPN